MAQVTPLEVDEVYDEEDNFLQEQTVKSSTNCCCSINTVLVAMTSLIILFCVLVLSAVWVSAFSVQVEELSNTVRQEHFDNMYSATTDYLKTMLIMTESVKSQLYTGFDFKNQTLIADHTFRLYKMERKNLGDWAHAMFVGSSMGDAFGISSYKNNPMYMNITYGQNQLYWLCLNWQKLDYCKKNSTTPTMTLAPFKNIQILYNAAASNPGGFAFSPSFIDSTHPSLVLFGCVSSFTQGYIPPGKTFSNYVSVLFGSAEITSFLVEASSSIPGSVTFIIERNTTYLLSTDNPAKATVKFTNGTSIRYTVNNYGGKVSEIGTEVANQLGSKFDSLPCNNYTTLIVKGTYTSVKRLCTSEGIDWVFVLSVPQWNYIGSMLIAIIGAIVASVIIIFLGIIIAVFFSFKIVKPFKNLIAAFQNVSNMELDDLKLYKTLFSEVKTLQTHFVGMVDKIKLYRQFIPPHLLSKLDDNEDIVQESASQISVKKEEPKSFAHSNSETKVDMSSRSITTPTTNSKLDVKKQLSAKNMFSLHLEKKPISVIGVCMQGINRWFVDLAPEVSVDLLGGLYDQIMQISKPSNGQAWKFENETLLITFNASTNQNAHELKSIQTAYTLSTKLKDYTKVKLLKNNAFADQQELTVDFSTKIAIATQECLCGNIGTKQAMSFSIQGSIQQNIEMLLETAIRLDISILFASELKSKVDTKYQFRYIETKQLLADNVFTVPDRYKQSNIFKEDSLYELGLCNQVNMDEWMYELEEKEKKDKWKFYNQACEYYFDKEYDTALERIDEYLKNSANSTDLAAHNLRSVIMDLQGNANFKLKSVK
ncbi:predicted protein [Naegleria gruberi]|uniref:Predicted protein n=1 Tax=Naegleria gruberi TaxID=5762 RepID=D2VJU2_NAEGR|nr:uncharacterized protein NAEGRDRAFT_69161 [Naegleria gruberi]EFC42748.1 predicted protein [Naegleria gruberi]|eukprot:XP_002675492.1 predicted protein [Naegleria gruberi strain NEG-M]